MTYRYRYHQRLHNLLQATERRHSALSLAGSAYLARRFAKRFSCVVATVLLGSLSSAIAANAAVVIGQPAGSTTPIASLRDGNYRFCSSRTTLANALFPTRGRPANTAGACFRFRKQASQIVGDYYYPSVGASVCLTGSLRGNTITGQAIERLLPGTASLVNYQQSVLTNWRAAGFLKVADGSLIEGSNDAIQYESASLNLEDFYRYNAGYVAPPSDCSAAANVSRSSTETPRALKDLGTSPYYAQSIYLDENSVESSEEGVYTYTTVVGIDTRLNETEYRVDCVNADTAAGIQAGGAQILRSRYYDSDGDLQGLEIFDFSETSRSDLLGMLAAGRNIQPNAASQYVCEQFAQISIPDAEMSPTPAGDNPAGNTTGTPIEIEIAPTTRANINYKRYRNDRFDYSVLYPAEQLIPQGETGSQGETFRSEAEDIVLRVSGVNQTAADTLAQRYERAQTDRTVTYRTMEDNDFFVVSGRKAGNIFYQKTFLENGVFKVLDLVYDEALQPEFGPIASVIGDSFAPVQTGSDLAQLPPEVQRAVLASASNNTEAESAIFEVVSVESRTSAIPNSN